MNFPIQYSPHVIPAILKKCMKSLDTSHAIDAMSTPINMYIMV